MATDQQQHTERLVTMIRGVLTAEGDAIGCEDCFELLDHCADLIEEGNPWEQVYPHVKRHLDGCSCCSQEFDALRAALDAARPTTAD